MSQGKKIQNKIQPNRITKFSREGQSLHHPHDENHQAQFQTQIIQTNILPPEVLSKFNDLVPGSAKELLELSINETRIRRDHEERVLAANLEMQARQMIISERQISSVFKSDITGQISGLIVCLSCIVGAVYLGATGAPWQAVTAVCAIPTAAVIKAFTFPTVKFPAKKALQDNQQ